MEKRYCLGCKMQLIDKIKYIAWWSQNTKKVDFTFDYNLWWINPLTCLGYSKIWFSWWCV